MQQVPFSLKGELKSLLTFKIIFPKVDHFQTKNIISLELIVQIA